MPKASIIICSYKRPASLRACLQSIEEQNFRDYEIILCEEEGQLVELKDKGWRKSSGEILIWIDDDIVVQAGWLSNIVTIFDTRPDIIGVTGPTYVPTQYLKNRDIFREGKLKNLYNWFFLENKHLYPGKITSCGANTYGANFPTALSTKTHMVDFLEPSQFAIRRQAIEKASGFDLNYEGVSEWCDVDLCYRLKPYGKLLYHTQVKVYHYPVNDITTNKRLETASRYRNYCRWADRYIKKTFKHRLYRLFLWSYFKLKDRGII